MIKQTTLAAITQMRKPQPKAAPKPEKSPEFEPTAEQKAKGHFVQEPIVDVGKFGRIVIGKAYRRHARFENIKGLGTEQLKALRYYRKSFDSSEISAVKSALDLTVGGGLTGSDAALSRLEARAFAGHELRAIESALGAQGLETLRAVALLDMTFSEVAMARFGARHVDYIVVGKGKRKPRSETKLAPKSGAHREAIRKEFFEAVSRLVDVVAPSLRSPQR